MKINQPLNEYGRILLSHADDSERHDRLAAASVNALRDSGALALRTPPEHGGTGADAPTVARRLAELGRACPSAGWTAGTCATSKTLVALQHNASARKEYFADPDALVCGSGVPSARGVREADGVRVTGRWDNVTGSEAAEWAGLALMVDGAFHIATFPLADLTVERNWHMAGMRGTGSQRLVADGVLVPAYRVVQGGPFQPQTQLFFRLCVLAPVVGAAQGALDVAQDMFASDRKPFMTSYTRMGDSPGARHWLAQAATLVNRADTTMLVVARAAEGEDLTEIERAQLRTDLAGAAKDCRSALELLLDLHGSSGFRDSNALQRYWRDVAVGSRHPLLNAYLATEDLGSVLVA
ncbi:acyl-CoA dehydrogenase family protein [Streptomyces dioscori]|uniref:acyl-CoA dehydrogenase family protein n=1 Tax=Streptomyces dioscori TaxID=2109333 RepID=UPI001CEC486A|nr:acyl-CoA dehydrogenase family protein [Streptomyces dioscori]